MNRTIFMGILFLLTIGTAGAQEKQKSKGQHDEIIIKQKKEGDQKMTIVIDGDKITINGKPLAEYKGDELIIRKKELENLRIPMEQDMESMNEDIARMQFEIQRSMVPRMKQLNRIRIEGLPDGDNEDFNFKFNFDDDQELKALMDSRPRAQLGISMEKADKGVKITDITSETAASKAGLKEGDIITKFNGQAVTEPETLAKLVREKKPGDEVELAYLRTGEKKEKKIKVTLGASKNSADTFLYKVPSPPMSPLPPMPPMTWGWNNDSKDKILWRTPGDPGKEFFQYENNRPMLGIKIQDTEDSSGVKVLDVDEESQAENAGIKENDIITQIDGRQIRDTDDAREALQSVQGKNLYTVKLMRNGNPVSIDVKIPRKLKKADL